MTQLPKNFLHFISSSTFSYSKSNFDTAFPKFPPFYTYHYFFIFKVHIIFSNKSKRTFLKNFPISYLLVLFHIQSPILTQLPQNFPQYNAGNVKYCISAVKEIKINTYISWECFKLLLGPQLKVD